MARADARGGRVATEARQAPLIRDATKDDAAAIARVHVDSWRAASILERDQLGFLRGSLRDAEKRSHVLARHFVASEHRELHAESRREIVRLLGEL